MNYQEMSDFDISKAVGNIIGVEWANLSENYNPLSIWPNDNFRKGEDGLFIFDPCNSWADAGPIAEEFKIAVAPYKKGDGYIWQAFGPGEENYSQIYDRNPRRAICIVFLMMKGGE